MLKMKKALFAIALLGSLAACGGPDYEPVYFASGQGSAAQPEKGTRPSLSESAHCTLNLKSKLCVKIKGKNLEVGTNPADLLCADTPPIPFEIQGSKIFLKGNTFPDIQVHVKVKGVDTPMTINGRGDGDGMDNIGQGTWAPEGEIEIQGFSFYINVLGVSGKIPDLTLTTGAVKETPELEVIHGKPAGTDGQMTLVTSTVLGHLFPAADKFLLGASMQATFEGELSPPLAECRGKDGTESKALNVVKLLLTPSGELLEEPLPGGNILEVSTGTFLAESPKDVGPAFESEAFFKMTNEGDEDFQINLPAKLGPFYFSSEGRTQRLLKPGSHLKFRVVFRPTKETVQKPGSVKQSIRFGPHLFYLMGIVLAPDGKTRLNQIDDQGQITAGNVADINLSGMAVPSGTVKKYFRCQTLTCEGSESITQCRPCTPPDVKGCLLKAVNKEGRPMEEVGKNCKPLYEKVPPQMNLDLAGSPQIPMNPSKQVFTIQNTGVKPLTVKKVFIEEWPNSKSQRQFQVAVSQTLPVTLAPYQKGFKEEVLHVTVSYLPNDLIGADGAQATSGLAVLDRAILKIETESGVKQTELTGKTQIQEVPELQAYFGSAAGVKGRASGETFALEEVTAVTEDLAAPVFLKMADAAAGGLRITEVKIQGKDAAFFEWLDSQEKVETRQPAAGSGKRCSIPVLDPTTGRMIDERFDLNFTNLGSQGFDLKPGAFTEATMPLFGCLNFHKDPAQTVKQRLFEADLRVSGLKLDAQGKLEKNPDGSFKQMQLSVKLVAAIDPLKGKFVLRITQTLAAILNPTAPSLASMPAQKEVELMMQEGRGSLKELNVLIGSVILDPFDEMEITNSKGEVVSKPSDGVTAVFRELDTRPSPKNYAEDLLLDFTSLVYDSDLPVGKNGIFYDYASEGHPLPDPLKISGWRIFTGALSYPGPLHPRSPIDQSQCEEIDPCSPDGLAKFTESGAGADGKGACAFFYTSGARYHSPAFEAVIQNAPHDLCETRDQPQELFASNSGHYTVDGAITFEDLGLRFWGPNYFLNPHGPLGFKPTMDELFHIAFTTEMLKPKRGPKDYNVLPDEKIDFSKLEHKINLTEASLSNPPMCPTNTNNRTLGGRKYSSWNYFREMWFKDEAGEMPAGCPEPDNEFKGGTAFLRGRRIDPQTGTLTLVTAAKFGNREELSLAFKNVMIFMAMNAWLCDPQGDPANFEGEKCFDATFNERDAKAQMTYIKE